MSGLLIELQDWTPEQREAVARVEMMRMKRAIRHYPSTLAVSGDVATPLPPCAYPGTASTSLPAADDSALTPLGADDSAVGNPPLPSMASTLAWAAAAIAGWALFGWGVIALVDAARSVL